ncbi:MAG: aminotransferase class V-fold PLP-dependent enzyme [Bryobacteraceae bacterium]
MPVDWSGVRAQFPALEKWTFLNTATYGQMPRRGVEAVARHFARRDELACYDHMAWYDDVDAIRASVARLIRCAPADIAFVPNASTALSLLLARIEWKPGDRIVTLEHEFPNHYYFPARLAAAGVEFVETPFEKLEAELARGARLVMLSTVSYATGFRAPLERISAWTRQRGILLYIDGTQSAGALRFDASAIRPSMFAVHAYKWLLSPNGAGFMYVAPDVREWLEPAVIGWRSDAGWRNPDCLHHGSPWLTPDAEKYEGGMLAFPSLYAMGAAVDMILELGPAEVEARVLTLAAAASGILARHGGEALSRDSNIVTARFAGRDASVLASALKDRRVLVAARRGNLRVSPHLYNDESDLARLDSALADILDA